MLTGPVPIAGGSDMMGLEIVAADPVERLYEANYRSLLRVAYLLLGSHEEAEEVVQEAFTRLVGSLWRLRRVDAAPGYLRAAVVNGARSSLRRKGVARRHAPALVVDDSGAERAASPPPRPDQVAEHTHVVSALRVALDRLPDRQRECLVLRYYLGLSEAETADAMGVAKGSVKTHHSRAVAALGGLMEEYR